VNVSLAKLRLLHGKMAGRVRYGLGRKAPSLSADSNTITHIDCSGFVRFVLYRASSGTLALPDGSWVQQQWCERHLRRLQHTSDVVFAAQDPGRLFVVFMRPSAIRPRSAGHVWLCRSDGNRMMTMESCGGRGVCSRPWNTPVLRDHASAAYEVPAEA